MTNLKDLLNPEPKGSLRQNREAVESLGSKLVSAPVLPSVRDVLARWHRPVVDAASPVVTDLQAPLHAIGLHGYCPPGTMAFVAPRGNLPDITGLLVAGSIWRPTLNDIDTGSMLSPPPTVVVLRPGDVVDFGRTLESGVSVLVTAPWYDWTNTFDAQRGPMPAPLIRAWAGDAKHAGHRLPYAPIGYTWSRAAPALEAAPAAGTPFTQPGAQGVPFDSSVRTVRLHIVSGGATSVDVYWLDKSGLWQHNDADDWDAAGLGAASATHTSETYEVNGSCLGVCCVRAAGDVCTIYTTLSE